MVSCDDSEFFEDIFSLEEDTRITGRNWETPSDSDVLVSDERHSDSNDSINDKGESERFDKDYYVG